MASQERSRAGTPVGHDPARPVLDLDSLPRQARAAVEGVLGRRETDVVSGGEVLGTLTFRARVLEGNVVRPREPDDETATAPRPDGVTVVATTMRMSSAARERLATAMGEGYLVVDFADAPPTTDVVLAHAVSHQLMSTFAAMFPRARIVVTEILDEELGLHVRGPVGVLLAAGAHAYLPPQPVEDVARTVHAYLTAQPGPALEAGGSGSRALGPPSGSPEERT
ncbi:hypothetical protein [Nocardioides korecus]